jgi:hypothetical protein
MPIYPRHIPNGFTAENAYVIGGHGANGVDTFIVPPNSLVIVKAKESETVAVDDHSQYLGKIAKMSTDILMDPLHNIPTIMHNLGAIRIYYPGDECPNFTYKLWPFVRTHDDILGYGPGGVIPVASLQRMNPDLFTKKFHARPKFDSSINFPDIYSKDAIFPDNKMIMDIYEKHSDIYRKHLRSGKRNGQISQFTILRDIINEVESSDIHITQKELCEDHSGIYYNIVCRVVSADMFSKLYNIVNSDGRVAKKEFNGFSKNKTVKNVQLAHIENTLMRKQHLRNYYTSNQYKLLQQINEELELKYAELEQGHDTVLKIKQKCDEKLQRAQEMIEDVEAEIKQIEEEKVRVGYYGK